jgi:hypothetical protein
VPIILVFDILLDLLGGVPEHLHNGIEKCSIAFPTIKLDNNIKFHFGALFPLINCNSSSFSNGAMSEFHFEKHNYQYKVVKVGFNEITLGELISVKKDQMESTDVHYFQLLKIAFNVYLNLRN